MTNQIILWTLWRDGGLILKYFTLTKGWGDIDLDGIKGVKEGEFLITWFGLNKSLFWTRLFCYILFPREFYLILSLIGKRELFCILDKIGINELWLYFLFEFDLSEIMDEDLLFAGKELRIVFYLVCF